jgi:hypothetical protein
VKAPCMHCNDCGVDVVAIGELYMCPDEVWDDELGLGWNDNLCLGCLETRLGRTVKPFVDVLPVLWGTYPWMKPSSKRMWDRFKPVFETKKKKPRKRRAA